jgi:hypothetical protein
VRSGGGDTDVCRHASPERFRITVLASWCKTPYPFPLGVWHRGRGDRRGIGRGRGPAECPHRMALPRSGAARRFCNTLLGPKLATISIEEAEERWGLPRIVDNYPGLPVHTHRRPKKPANLDVLLELMRNGLMHGNIEPITGSTGEITRISIENRCGCHRCNGAPTWGTTLDVSELRQIFDAFVGVADHLYEVATRKQPDKLPTRT